jgi:hypothetical protein
MFFLGTICINGTVYPSEVIRCLLNVKIKASLSLKVKEISNPPDARAGGLLILDDH